MTNKTAEIIRFPPRRSAVIWLMPVRMGWCRPARTDGHTGIATLRSAMRDGSLVTFDFRSARSHNDRN